MEGKESGEVGMDSGSPCSVQNSLERSMLTPSPSPDSCHDSCYDSDSSSPSSRRGSAFLSHEDVSRTVSDTLGAETDDNVAEKENKTLLNNDVTLYPDYESKVEYTIKLGYKEHHLQEVLRQCGPEVGQNELLNELIKVSEGDETGILLDQMPDESELIINETYSPIDIDSSSNLRPIVIDGSNVALSHGNKKVFSCRGIEIAVDWFRGRGHSDIKVIIPSWRKEATRPDAPITDQELLFKLEKDGFIVFTPSRRVGGKRVVCYDDRYTVKHASEVGGIIVSNDTFRDLMAEDPLFKKVVEERLLQYTFINDRFMPPDDPLGRKGPSLDNFLRKEPLAPEHLPPLCPYDKKCTYGNKCKFYHPERGLMPHKSVTEKLAAQAKLEFQKVKEKQALKARDIVAGDVSIPKIKVTATESAPLPKRTLSRTKSGQPAVQKMQLGRTKSLTAGRGQSPVKDTRTGMQFGIDSRNSAQFGQDVQIFNQLGKQQVNEMRTSSIARHGQMCGPVPNIRFGEVDSDVTSYPQHWITGHEDLKYTVSEPIPIQEQPLRGHLALAKKLSDEGRKEEKPDVDGTQNLHKKLNRQLSLKGSEDPRVQRKLISNSQQPKFYFGSDFQAKPVQDQNQNYNFIRNEYRAGQNTQLPPRKQPLSKKNSERYLSPFCEHQMATHNAVLRMSSAPSETETKDATFAKSGPKMERQSSTSDPQLYIPNLEDSGDTDVFVDPYAAASNASISSEAGVPLGIPFVMQDQMQARQPPQNFLQYPPPINVSMSEQNLHFDHARQAPYVFKPEMYPPGNYQMTSEHQKAQSYGMPPKMHAHSNPNLYHHNSQQIYHLRQTQMQQSPMDFGTGSLNLSVPLNDKSDRHLGLVDTKDALLWGNSQNVNQAWPESVAQQGNASDNQANMIREGLYYRLCGLFPKEKVAKVMQEHPEEMDPAVLCKYILC